MIFWKQQLKVRRLFNICLRSKCNSLLDHTNYVLYKRFENIHYNTLTRSSWRIFNPMRYTGFIHSSSCKVDSDRYVRYLSDETIRNWNFLSSKMLWQFQLSIYNTIRDISRKISSWPGWVIFKMDSEHKNKKIGFYPKSIRSFLRVLCVVDDSHIRM